MPGRTWIRTKPSLVDRGAIKVWFEAQLSSVLRATTDGVRCETREEREYAWTLRFSSSTLITGRSQPSGTERRSSCCNHRPPGRSEKVDENAGPTRVILAVLPHQLHANKALSPRTHHPEGQPLTWATKRGKLHNADWVITRHQGITLEPWVG